MRKAISVLALLVLGATLATAQTSTDAMVGVATGQPVIDGKSHPEQIPHDLGLRLWLSLKITETDPIARKIQEQNILPFFGVTDSAAGARVLETVYYQPLQLLITAHNTNVADSEASFWYYYQNIVNSTDLALKNLSSPSRVESYIQSKKQFMHASGYDYFLPNSAQLRKEAQMVASSAGMVPGGMLPNYSFVWDIAIQHSGTSDALLWIEAQTSGTSSLNPPPTPPPSTKHTASATITLLGQGGTIYGVPSYPTSYISATEILNTIHVSQLVPNPPPITIGGAVQCTTAGQFFSDFISNFTLGVTRTYTQLGGLIGPDPELVGMGYPNAKKWDTLNGCTLATTPPDQPINFVSTGDGSTPPQYELTIGLTLYYGKTPTPIQIQDISWIASTFIPGFYIPVGIGVPATGVPAVCTKWAAGYPPGLLPPGLTF